MERKFSSPEDDYPRIFPESQYSGFDEFFYIEFKPVCRHLITFGALPEEACDATQEAMIQVAQRGDSIRAPRAFVRKVALREYIASVVNLKRVTFAITPKHGVTEEGLDETASILELT